MNPGAPVCSKTTMELATKPLKENLVMKHLRLAINLALLSAGMLAVLVAGSATHANRKAQATKFTVRVENISDPAGYEASNGTRWPFALSPGLFVLQNKKSTLFVEGKPASKALESQAEDGDPSGLVGSLESMHHATNMHGVFNTPVGTMGPGPIRPGNSYEFSFTASAGMRLFMTMMFGQSNDSFYSPEVSGISLFDDKGNPLSGDVTDKFVLWDAGTEVNQELGIGADQGPRQQAINTGADEHGVVHRATDLLYYSKTGELFRVTITPETGM
jgi:hypothetical protein